MSRALSYALIRGTNGWVHNDIADGLEKAFKAMKDEKATITVVAFDKTDGNWALVNDQGGAKWAGPPPFSAKMRDIDRKEIKQISFGSSESWAIVMKNGGCHYSAFTNPEGPATKIAEHQGNISFVSMTPNTREWVVGFGNNGWSSWGISRDLTQVINEFGCWKIHWISLGNSKERWIIKTRDTTRWSHCEDFSQEYGNWASNGDVIPALWG